MSRLEDLLVALGRSIEEPEPPEIAGKVVARLRREAAPMPKPRRRQLAIAIAGVAAFAAVIGATPARTELIRFFHLGGISVVRVEELPPVNPRPGRPVAPGRELGFEQALGRVHFPVSLPRKQGRPDHSFYYGYPPGGQLTLIYGSARQPRLLITEFLGSELQEAFHKQAGPRTKVEVTSVNGAPAIWLGGATHIFSFLDRHGVTQNPATRLAGNTLVWQRGPVTLRLEGELSKSKAIRLAESFEPVPSP